MAIFAPTAIAAANYPTAQQPIIGAARRWLMSTDPILPVATITVTGADTCTFLADTVNTVAAAGSSLVVAVKTATGLVTVENPVITLAGTKTGASAITGVATIAPPAYAGVQTKVYPKGYAVDAAVTNNDTFITLTGATINCDADATGQVFVVYRMPALASFTDIGWERTTSWDPVTPEAISIPNRFDGTAASLSGRSTTHSLSATLALKGMADGISRFDGVRCTGLIKVVKADRLTTDHIFFQNVVPRVSATIPDGNEEASVNLTALYEDLIMMPAMGS